MLFMGLLVAGQAALADVIVTDDGRRFEGEIVVEGKEAVKIDAIIATIRSALTVKRAEIKSVEKKPVPPEVRFDTVTETRGLEAVRAVRTDQAPSDG
jgi:hypothetical protein